MNSRERLLAALDHKESDRVPLDLGGSHVTGIHIIAYRNLCRHIGIDPEPVVFSDVIQQVVVPGEQVLERFGVDVCGIFPLCSHNWGVEGVDIGDYYEYVDEWGFVQHFPKKNGHYWSIVASPIDGMMADQGKLDALQWPDAANPKRIAGLREKAMQIRKQGRIVMLKGLCAGLFEMGQRVRGMENFLCDLLVDKVTAEKILDKILELKIQFWDMALNELGDLVDIVVESDDYGTQESQLVSFETYSELIEPRLRKLTAFLKNKLNKAKVASEGKGYVFLHSCGNIRPFLPGFIDMGVDIINPVHLNAAGMEPESLKNDFGKDVTFWGGGVETQNVLPNGSVQQVKDDVERNLDILAPGGGFVFNTVHNIQADVPPENIVAMYEALGEFGKY
jgi:uroporphyrinogen decarboxylase